MSKKKDPTPLIREVSFEGATPRTRHLQFKVRWALLEGRYECVGLSIDLAAHVRVRPLQRHDLDVVKMGEVLERGAALLAENLSATEEHTRDAERRLIEKLMGEYPSEWAADHAAEFRALQAAVPGRPGRPRIPEETLREVAEVYNDALSRGEHPTKAVREHFGIKPDRAKSWVLKCRQSGLLPPTRRGIARGKKEES